MSLTGMLLQNEGGVWQGVTSPPALQWGGGGVSVSQVEPGHTYTHARNTHETSTLQKGYCR